MFIWICFPFKFKSFWFWKKLFLAKINLQNKKKNLGGHRILEKYHIHMYRVYIRCIYELCQNVSKNIYENIGSSFNTSFLDINNLRFVHFEWNTFKYFYKTFWSTYFLLVIINLHLIGLDIVTYAISTEKQLEYQPSINRPLIVFLFFNTLRESDWSL